MWTQLLQSLLSLFEKSIPWLAALFAYLKGRSSVLNEIDRKNLEKQKEYVEIRADKSGSVDDDLGRMQDGTY